MKIRTKYLMHIHKDVEKQAKILIDIGTIRIRDAKLSIK